MDTPTLPLTPEAISSHRTELSALHGALSYQLTGESFSWNEDERRAANGLLNAMLSTMPRDSEEGAREVDLSSKVIIAALTVALQGPRRMILKPTERAELERIVPMLEALIGS